MGRRRQTGIGKTLQTGRRIRGRLVASVFLPNRDPLGPTREMLMVSVASKRRVDKRAVVRNRAKRRLRAAMGLVLNAGIPAIHGQLPTAWVVIANRDVATCPWSQLVDEVGRHWNEILAAGTQHGPSEKAERQL